MTGSGEAATRSRGRRRGAVVVAGLSVGLLAGCHSGHALRTAPPTPATTVPPTTTTIPTVSYTVKYGDSLGSIAKQFGVPVAAIAAANHITDPDKLTAGQVIVIPLPPVPPSTTTTTAPPPSPLKMSITPPDGPIGTVFTFNVTGATPGGSIVFEIDSPDGRKFTGQPHTALPGGAVTATYLTTEQNVPGQYNVIATGAKGISARGSFQLNPSGGGSTTSTRH